MKKIFAMIVLGSAIFCASAQSNLQVALEAVNGSCVNDYSARIAAFATGGTSPYTYLWNTNDVTSVIENLADGTYTVTVTDKTGISVTAEATVTTSAATCCSMGGNSFPQYPEQSDVPDNKGYDLNFLQSQEVVFCEEFMQMNNDNLYIMEGVQLVIASGATLMVNNCTFSACGNMWKGIVIENGGTLIMRGSSVRDAERGIYAMEGSKFYVYDNQFINDEVGIENPQTCSIGHHDKTDFGVAGNTFDVTAEGLRGPYPGQPPHGTKPMAGIIFHNMLGTIGDFRYNENKFSNMNCGIISTYSTLTIINNKFEKIENDGYYPAPYMGSAIAAFGGFGGFSIAIKPYNQQGISGPTFESCDYGVYAENNINVSVTGCSMNSVKTGILIQGCHQRSTIILEGNDIAGKFSGINLIENEGADLISVAGNNILTWNGTGTCITATESGRGQNNLSIQGNTLNCDGSLYGIDLVGCSGSIVYGNSIDEISLPGAKGFTGISLSGCSEPIVSCNIINGITDDNGHGSNGIRVNVTDNAVLHCNSTNLTSYGISFFGPCITENNIKDNDMNQHYIGLLLNSNAVIGLQEHGGNLWYGPFPADGYGAMNRNIEGGTITSLFRVHTGPNTIYYPSIPADNAGWFQTRIGTPYSCNAVNECPDKSSERSASMSPNTLDNSIANNDPLSVDFIPETQSMSQQFLYDRLTDTPALLDSSSTLDDFYVSNSGSPVGVLQQVSDNIGDFDNYNANISNSYLALDNALNALSDSITVLDSLTNNDSLNAPMYIAQKESLRTQANALQNNMVALKTQMESLRNNKVTLASNVNSNIIAGPLPENNEKIINDIYLSTVAAGVHSLDGPQSSTVLSIAQQCPYAGGKAVYRARALYRLVDETMEYDDDSTCLVFGIYRQYSQSSSKTEPGTIILIPNPAQDKVTVFYSASEGTCYLYMMDITGKVVKQVQLDCTKTSYELSVSDISTGIYMISVMNEDNSIGRKKLAITR